MGNDQDANIRILHERVVYSNQYGALHDDDVEFQPAGVRGHYLRWRWSAPYSVAVLALIDSGTALLIRSFRHAARQEVVEVVKGFGDETREPRDIAEAELREELGFSAAELTFLGITDTDPSFAHHAMHCFLATGQVDQERQPETSEEPAGDPPSVFRGRGLPVDVPGQAGHGGS